MEELKKMVWTCSFIFGVSILLIGVVYAHDHREEMCFIDHLCHFHFNEQSLNESAERKNKEDAAKREGLNSMMRDMRSIYQSGEGPFSQGGASSPNEGYAGTCGPPDRDN